MTTFKKGDKFIPRKPKENDEGVIWNNSMDIYDGQTLMIDYITIAGNIKPKEGVCLFHPDWCEKVGNSEIPNNHIPDVGKTIDWEQRKYELAKSAMQGLTTNEYYLKICASKAEDNKTEWENILCSNAINVADEMIKQLKQQ